MKSKIIKQGTYKGLHWWITKNGREEDCPLLRWYCAYIETPKKNTNYFKDGNGDLIKGGNIVAIGYEINAEEDYRDLQVNGGVNYGITNNERTVIGWDYAHCWNEGWDEDLEEIQEQVEQAIDTLIEKLREE